jgi:hypothetical protein
MSPEQVVGEIASTANAHGGQPGVEPVPTGGTALPLHTTPTHNNCLKVGERWGVGGGCRLKGNVGRGEVLT